MRIKAAVLYEQGLPRPYTESRPLRIEEVELDPPGPGEVLIEIAAAGLCHSDLSTIENLRPRPLPIIIGHEGAGIVRECGPGVRGLAPGDHVVALFVTSCGECRDCVRGKPNICASSFAARAKGTLPSGARRLKRLDGAAVNHNSGLSLFAEYAVVTAESVVKIGQDIPLEDAALFGCAVMTGAGAVFNTARLRPGEDVAVVGLGGVGMSALLGAVAGGASRIIAVDRSAEKLALARQWGATDTFLADEGCVEAVREATGGGVDTVIETAGVLPALELSVAITARGGQTITAGLPHVQARFAFSPFALVSEERSIRASYMGSCVPRRDLPMMLDLYRRGKLPVDRLRSGFVSLEEMNLGFERLAEGSVLRQILRPHSG